MQVYHGPLAKAIKWMVHFWQQKAIFFSVDDTVVNSVKMARIAHLQGLWAFSKACKAGLVSFVHFANLASEQSSVKPSYHF
jgi:hypothetical protein